MQRSEDMPAGAEEDDVVVREMDVYVSDQVDLYLLQYTLRPANAPPLDVKHAQFKPKHKVLEVFAEHDAKRTGLLKLASSSVSSKTSLGIAVLSDDAIHITPLQEVLQMRPVFRNLPNSNRGEEQGADGSGTDEDEEQRNSSQRPVLQQVLLKKKESDRAQSARVQSYSHLIAQEENEAFRKLDTYSIEESQVIFDRMYALEEPA
jgi:DNA-directed RNA polymerase-3 subunit RPC5